MTARCGTGRCIPWHRVREHGFGQSGLLLSLFAACAAGAAGAWLYGAASTFGAGGNPGDADTTELDSPTPDARSIAENSEHEASTEAVTAMQKQLEQEQAATLQLQRQIAVLETDIEQLQAQVQQNTQLAQSLESRDDENSSAPNSAGDDAIDTGSLADIQGHEGVNFGAEGSRRGRRWQEEDSERRVDNLVSAGLDETVATELARQIDQQTLAELELRDLASREGWRDSERFDTQLDELRESAPDLRTELGEQAYDQYLFQSGRGNRVEIRSVITGSAADTAGIQRGDIVLEYAGTRMFAINELQQATRSGSRGETIAVRLQRDGQEIDTSIVRGPLGVTLMPRQIAPGES